MHFKMAKVVHYMLHISSQFFKMKKKIRHSEVKKLDRSKPVKGGDKIQAKLKACDFLGHPFLPDHGAVQGFGEREEQGE